jgi:predicted RNA-binding protein Jag
MDSIEADGDSIDAAIQNALATLGVGRERVEIEILTAGSRGLFGIGSRQARVRATLRRPVVDTEDDAGADVRSPRAKRLWRTRPSAPPNCCERSSNISV